MYTLSVLDDFSAAHQLPGSGGDCERLHGHNWKVQVQVRSEVLNEQGMIIDFKDLKALTHEVLKELDHRFLNELSFFHTHAPTAENLARHIFLRIASLLPPGNVRLQHVRIWESETSFASYEES